MFSLRGIPARTIGVLLALISTSALAGCAGSPSLFLPASPNATTIYNLTVIVFLIAAGVFIIVEALLFWSVIRFSRNKTPGEPKQIEGNTTFEILWTAAPAIVLLIVFVVSLQALFPLSGQPSTRTASNSTTLNVAAADTVHVRVIGHQWWWEFQYPDFNIVTANELHLPVNSTVSVDVESVDVIHSFWVPQLGGKIDVIPGHVNHTWFQPNQLGTFHGQCAEFCGTEHADMRFNVVVEAKDQFQVWVQNQQAPVATMSGLAAQGEQIFMNGVCVGCHTVNGTKAQGKVGPNLTHLATRSVFAGAIMDMTPDNLTRWLTDPQKVKPGTLMKIPPLTPDQISALVAYLTSLK